MGHARKLELLTDDESELEFRDALELLIADFAARHVLDEQVMPDISESGSYAPPDQSISDGPDDLDTAY